MKQAPAALSWSLTLYCPFCKELIWLEDHDEDGMYATLIFNNKWNNFIFHLTISIQAHINYIFWRIGHIVVIVTTIFSTQLV